MKLSQLLRYGGIGCLLAVVWAGPFFQGLFFWTPLLAAIGLVSLGFLLWLAGRRMDGSPLSVWGGATGLALLALLLCYLLQFAWAVYPRGNLDWVLRVAAGWMAYLMVRAESGEGLRRWLSWGLVVSAAAVSVAGFMDYTGYLAQNPEMSAVLHLVNLSQRMATPFEYWNTAAVYLLATLLVATGLAVEDPKPWRLAVLAGSGTLLSLAFFFTVSRGALIMLPVGLALLFPGLGRGKRWPALLLLLAAWAPAAVALNGVGANAAIHNWVSAFRWVGAAAAGGTLDGLILGCFLRLKPKLQAALVGGALVLAVAGFLLVRPAGSLLPKQAGRLSDINFQTVNVVLRLIYDKDAARMIADRPLGRGGWGWARTYQMYQAFNYTAREAHDHYAQTAVEAGIPGLIALLAAFAAAFVTGWQSRRAGPLAWSLSTGALLIAAHSLIDFNLSYGAIWLLVWALLAGGAAPAAEWRLEKTARFTAWTVGGAAVIAAATLFIGSAYSDKAQAEHEMQRADHAAALARMAVRFDPWNSDPYLVIGDRAALQRAAMVDPLRSQVRYELAIRLQLENDLPGALREARAALAVQPMVSAYYTKTAELAGLLMVDAVSRGDRDGARSLASELTSLGNNLLRRKAAADPLQHLWSAPALQMEPLFQLRYGQALYLMGDQTAAEPYLKVASKVGLLGSEADVWLYAIYERRGDKAALAALESKPWIRFRMVNPVYQAVRGL